MSTVLHRVVVAAVASAYISSANASLLSDSVPELSSRPGASYTIYLDPSGFAYDGDWIGETPGTNLGLHDAAPTETFTADEQDLIRAIWARTANQYRSFDVNITTIDPAVAAGEAGTDLARKNYYDSQAKMMHTVIGPPGNPGWQGSADGLAGLNVIDHVVTPGSGEHTNWMFTQDVDNGSAVADGTYIGSITSHEGGHTFGLQHQGDYTGGVLVNEYSDGDDATGDGSYVGIMGNASDRQRVAWRVGSAHDDFDVTFTQNDVSVIMGNSGMTIVDSGIGHSFATATDLPINGGGMVDSSDPLHRGVISPIDSGSGYDPIGFTNYTTDFFLFQTDGTTPITLTVNNGNDLLNAGTADNGATLRSFLEIFDSTFTSVNTGTEDASTLLTSYSDLLAAGTYYAQITSFGGHDETTALYDAAQYYDMGGYFLTGNGFTTFVVPIPAAAWMGLVLLGGIGSSKAIKIRRVA